MPNELSAALDAKDETNADVDSATEGALTEGALTEGESVRFNARIPEPLRDAFSDLCQRKGRTMSSVVKEWMLRAVKEDEI